METTNYQEGGAIVVVAGIHINDSGVILSVGNRTLSVLLHLGGTVTVRKSSVEYYG